MAITKSKIQMQNVMRIKPRLWWLGMMALMVAPDLFAIEVVFEKTFGGSLYDHGYSVQQTSDGGFIIAGDAQDYVISAEKTYQDLSDGTWFFNIRGSFSSYA